MKRETELHKRFEALDGAINRLKMRAIVQKVLRKALTGQKGGEEIKDELPKLIEAVGDATDKLKEFVLGRVPKEE